MFHVTSLRQSRFDWMVMGIEAEFKYELRGVYYLYTSVTIAPASPYCMHCQ